MSTLKKLIAMLLFATISSTAFAAITDAQLFAYAEANYSSIFTGAATAGQTAYQGSSYDYRYYPASKNYLAVDTTGGIYVLGPVSGNAILNVGTLTAFASTVTAWEATQDACIAASSKWALWTGGTCLRGANIWQTLVSPSAFTSPAPYWGSFGTAPYGPGPYTQADFDKLAALGANVVNISGPGLYSETPDSMGNYVLDTVAQANLDDLLTKIQNANMFAILTVRSGPGRNMDFAINTLGERHTIWTSQTPAQALQAQAEQDAWVAMLRYTANRYKNNPIVVGYDIMCEPNSNMIVPTATVNTEFDPAYFYGTSGIPGIPSYANTSYDWNQLAQRITTAIRQVDTTTPILLESMHWGAASWIGSLVLTGDSKTVYTAHQYEPGLYTAQAAPYTRTYGTGGTYTKNDLVPQFTYLSSFKTSHNVHTAIDEWGVQRYEPGAAQFLDDEMALMESNGLNYAFHYWTPASLVEAYPLDGFDYRKGTDPFNHTDVPMPTNVLMTTIQTYFSKNTVRPSNRSF